MSKKIKKSKFTPTQRLENLLMGFYFGIFIGLVLGGAYVVGKAVIDVLSNLQSALGSGIMNYLG